VSSPDVTSAAAAPRNGGSADAAMPVRAAVGRLAEIVGDLPAIWVEGQVSKLRVRAGLAFLTLHDVEDEAVMNVAVASSVLNVVAPPVAEGSRIVVRGKPEIWVRRGELVLRAHEIRAVGVGELLERLEQLKRTLAAEGLFAAERKLPLPFAPTSIGLICGRASAAETDVVENAKRRWPAVTFVIREVAVQGARAVPQVLKALTELDANPHVDVIVITRGGGAFEDLLPFSDEALVRAVAAAQTPVVSAIGHEEDAPLLDLVADVRASTPTDAARRIVPDVVAERTALNTALGRARRSIRDRVSRELLMLNALRSRPVFADPGAPIRLRRDEIARLRVAATSSLQQRVQRQHTVLASLSASLRALSPAATLDRGFAIVRLSDGTVVRTPDQAPSGTPLHRIVAEGRVAATSDGPDQTPTLAP
jgi:exodeoxyribonuclease VII large subunit